MAAIRGQFSVLAKRQEPVRVGLRAVDPDQCLGPHTPPRSGAEQRVSAIDATNVDRRQAVDHSFDESRLHALDCVPVRQEPPASDHKADRDLIDPKDCRPAAGNDVEQRIHRRRFDCSEGGGIDGCDSVPMAASEGNEVFIRLFDRAEPFAQPGDSLSLERNDLGHVRPLADSG